MFETSALCNSSLRCHNNSLTCKCTLDYQPSWNPSFSLSTVCAWFQMFQIWVLILPEIQPLLSSLFSSLWIILKLCLSCVCVVRPLSRSPWWRGGCGAQVLNVWQHVDVAPFLPRSIFLIHICLQSILNVHNIFFIHIGFIKAQSCVMKTTEEKSDSAFKVTFGRPLVESNVPTTTTSRKFNHIIKSHAKYLDKSFLWALQEIKNVF